MVIRRLVQKPLALIAMSIALAACKAPATQFASSGGVAFNAQRMMPHTLIVSAEIGEGGPTGIYAVRL